MKMSIAAGKIIQSGVQHILQTLTRLVNKLVHIITVKALNL